MHPDDAAFAADVALPSERGGLFDRDARADRRRQHRVAVLARLLLEEVPGRHRHHAGADALGEQLLVRGDGERELAARRDQDQLGLAAGRVGQHVGAARDAGRRRVPAAVERRQRLARQRQHRRLVTQLHDGPIRLDHLVGVAGAQHDESRHRAQRRELLDRLVRGPVLAVAHRVVGEDEQRRELHQRREPDRRPRVVAEDEEGRAEGPQLRERHAVHRGRHRVLADAEVQVLAAVVGPARSRPRRRTSAWSCWRVRDPRSRRGTTGCSARARSAPGPTRRGRRCPWRRPGRRADCDPSRRAARGAASARSRRRAPATARDTPRTIRSTRCAPRRRARRCRRRNARAPRRVPGTSRPRASRRRAW